MIRIIILLVVTSCTHQQVIAPYNRKDWKHWTDSNRNCLNTRNEVLKKRSLVPVKMNKRGCAVLAGRWNDYYYPEFHSTPKKIDIDHIVPLKHAHNYVGARWSKKQKEKFANDPENLVITNRSYNRKKGAKGIDAWLPVHQEYACKYIKDWMKIKEKYQLPLSLAEEKTIKQAECKFN